MFGADLRDVDVEVADQVGFELRTLRLVALDVRQATDAVTLQTAMKRRAGQMRQARLQRLEAVIERQQSVPAESDDDRLVLQAKYAGSGLLRSHPSIGAGLA